MRRRWLLGISAALVTIVGGLFACSFCGTATYYLSIIASNDIPLKHIRSINDEWMGGVQPVSLYRNVFQTPQVEVVETLRGGGASWQSTDVWLRFETAEAVALQKPEGLKAVDSAEARAWFAEMSPDDAAALGSDDGWVCLYQTDPKHIYENGEWFLFHAEKGLYFYRYWHYS